MAELSKLIEAIAALLWPLAALTALLLFKSQIADLLSRIKKGKLLGQEVELSESLEQLQKSASELSNEVASIPSVQSESPEEAAEESRSSEEIITNIVHEASRSPKTAIILLASEIEKEARQTLASVGKLQGRRNIPISQAISELDSHYGLPKHVSSSLRLFWDIRNKIIHGGEADERNTLSAIDSGVTILKAIQALPRETNWVHHPGVEVYSDPECKNIIKGTKGVILKSASSSGARIFYRIFPTTKTYFKKGHRVTWEWSVENTWSDAWYRDIETNEIKLAWNSSAEFVGRDLGEI